MQTLKSLGSQIAGQAKVAPAAISADFAVVAQAAHSAMLQDTLTPLATDNVACRRLLEHNAVRFE